MFEKLGRVRKTFADAFYSAASADIFQREQSPKSFLQRSVGVVQHLSDLQDFTLVHFRHGGGTFI